MKMCCCFFSHKLSNKSAQANCFPLLFHCSKKAPFTKKIIWFYRFLAGSSWVSSDPTKRSLQLRRAEIVFFFGERVKPPIAFHVTYVHSILPNSTNAHTARMYISNDAEYLPMFYEIVYAFHIYLCMGMRSIVSHIYAIAYTFFLCTHICIFVYICMST